MPTYTDQRNDRSGAAIVKIASRMRDQKLAAHAVAAFFDPARNRDLDCMLKTAEDVMLSSVYFEAQKDSLPKAQAEATAVKLAAMRTLFGVSGDYSLRDEKKPAVKTAAENPKLEMRKIASCLTDGHGRGHSYEECRKMARKYTKLAESVGTEVPASIRLYRLDDLIPNENISDNIRLHKAACLRSGGDHKAFDALIDIVGKAGRDQFGLYKLASMIDRLDEENGLRSTPAGRTLPNGLETVFQCGRSEYLQKHAECDETKKLDADVDSMDKATVVARFGEGALDEVENTDGTIDRERLKNLVNNFGKRCTSC